MDRQRSQLDIVGKLQRQLADANDQIKTLRNQNLAIPDWINIGDVGAPAFQNSWVNYGGYNVAGFWRDSSGIVHLRGLIKLGTVGFGTPVFTLPVGFRPGQNILLGVHANGAEGRMDIDTSGNVGIIAGSNGYVAINTCFRAEN